jgi:tetratricopeptide (TPR) repeat protein
MHRSASLLTVLVLIALLSHFSSAKTENWLEVRSPHFTVLTNSGEKQARQVADRFERMREVFHKEFPQSRIDAAAPIMVIAAKDGKEMQALEPEAYLAKGSLNLAGLFLQTPDKNYVLLRLDAEGEHPYATVYHEYTHFVMRRAQEWLPLWLNEGLAQFYENTDIKEKEVWVGEPSAVSLMVLRQNKLLPLETLFRVDYKSPYYHEENKGSIFYAESWALTHYLTMKDYRDKTQHLTEYAKLVSNKVDALTAATQAFGDLRTLEKTLGQYVSQATFYAGKMAGATEVDKSTMQVQAVSATEADAIRADFLAYDERTKDCLALLGQVLKEEPNNVSAHETMGYLAFREGRLDEAGKWYEQAVNLDSKSFLAHYYFASIAMRQPNSAERSNQIESSLRVAIKLNPSFAPAFDQLAAFYGMRHKNLDEAAMLNLTAVELEPSNIGFRLNRANLMIEMDRPKDAIAVLQNAMTLQAKPEEMAALQARLYSIQQYVAARDTRESELREVKEQSSAMNATAAQMDVSPEEAPPALERRGPRRSIRGKLSKVECSYPAAISLTVDGGANHLGLRAANFYKVEYSALNFKVTGDLNPCKDLEGMTAKVEYFEAVSSSTEGQIISIELFK